MSDKYVVEKADIVDVANTIREKAEITEQLVWPEGFKNAIEGFSSLNFEVVGGTTQPSNPKENTIWVNTDQEITGWSFSAAEPENPDTGMVWIITDNNGIVKFNALKENAIFVGAESAYQYISGSRIKAAARIYQVGKWWALWEGVLYDNGDFSPYHNHGLVGADLGGATYGENYIEIYTEKSKATNAFERWEKVDLTNFNTLSAKVTAFVDNTGGDIRSGLFITQDANQVTYASASIKARKDIYCEGGVFKDASLNLDVSSQIGEWYVCVGVFNEGTWLNVRRVRISQLVLT